MALRIQKLGVAGYRQFKENILDFSHGGVSLSRVCFIGPNGTGKSTLLRLIRDRCFDMRPASEPRSYTLLELNDGNVWWLVEQMASGEGHIRKVEKYPSNWFAETWDVAKGNGFGSSSAARVAEAPPLGDRHDLARARSTVDFVWIPPDSEQEQLPAQNQLADHLSTVPLAPREPLFRRHIVGQGNGHDSLVRLQAMLAKGESAADQSRCVDFLNSFLERSLLEIAHSRDDPAGHSRIDLSRLIRLRSGGVYIDFTELSTGIRNFVIKIGHIFSIFRGDPARPGLILVDEPENSLHPDFLFDLVSFYERAAPGAQIFMATHSPIIAAQFKPEERFILEFDDEGPVVVRNGVSPEGDDPNDLLTRDFAVRTLYGKEGLAKWRRFHELDRLILEESEPEKRKALMREYLAIGRNYNFSPDEIPG